VLTVITRKLPTNCREEIYPVLLELPYDLAWEIALPHNARNVRAIRDEAEAPFQKVFNFAQTSESHKIKKVSALNESPEEPQSAASRGRRRDMKTSTKDQIEGSFHEAKGTIKEPVGKVTSDVNLKAEGKAEKKVGKAQQRISHAKEAVANLKEQLSDLKKTG